MKLRKIIAVAILSVAALNAANAQQTMRTAYFMDNYAYGYRFNPAFAPSYGHFSFALGNLGVSAESNMALSTFLYPTTNRLTTFLSPTVSNDEFLGKLKETNTFHIGIDENLLSLGDSNGKGRYASLEINLRSHSYAALPYDIFRFVKAGAQDGQTSYSISNLGIRTDNWVELAYGLSYEINDKIRAGGRAKLLVGLAHASVYLSDAEFTISDEIWKIQATGNLDANLPKGVELQTSNGINLNMGSVRNLRPGGYGAAIDLGATYKILDNLTASLAINDLGFIAWNNAYKGGTPAMAWQFDGFNEVTINAKEGESTVGDQFNDLFDDIQDCLRFDINDHSSSTTSLEAVINAGIEYDVTESFSAGALFTSHLRGMYSWSEARGIATWCPADILGLAGSAAMSSYGPSLGAVVNLKLAFLGLYLGVDSLLPIKEITPQYIPVGRINTNVNFGLHIAFGGVKKTKAATQTSQPITE